VSANEEQQAFWNQGPGGRNWSRHFAVLDGMQREVSALLQMALRPATGERILDAGCGAGALALEIAEAIASPGRDSGRVTGIDISAPLIAIARERAASAGRPDVDFLVADLQDHAFAPAAFDAAVSRFGLMFFADPVAAFRNIRAGTRPGGRLVFVAWAADSGNPWFSEARAAAVARLGAAAPSAPDAPGPLAFAGIPRVLGILAAAGWRDAGARVCDIGLDFEDGLPAALRLAQDAGPVSSVMRERGGSEADLAAILTDLGRRFAGFETDGRLRLPARVNLFEARA
jgi:SAM-dependent methyltransferase